VDSVQVGARFAGDEDELSRSPAKRAPTSRSLRVAAVYVLGAMNDYQICNRGTPEVCSDRNEELYFGGPTDLSDIANYRNDSSRWMVYHFGCNGEYRKERVAQGRRARTIAMLIRSMVRKVPMSQSERFRGKLVLLVLIVEVPVLVGLYLWMRTWIDELSAIGSVTAVGCYVIGALSWILHRIVSGMTRRTGDEESVRKLNGLEFGMMVVALIAGLGFGLTWVVEVVIGLFTSEPELVTALQSVLTG